MYYTLYTGHGTLTHTELIVDSSPLSLLTFIPHARLEVGHVT